MPIMHLAHPSMTKDRGIRAVGPSPRRGAPSWEHIGALLSPGDAHHAVSPAMAEDVGGKREHLSSDGYAPACIRESAPVWIPSEIVSLLLKTAVSVARGAGRQAFPRM